MSASEGVRPMDDGEEGMRDAGLLNSKSEPAGERRTGGRLFGRREISG